jgi:hypothetical protein
VTHVLVLALAAALNPTLVAASTLMMLLPNPKRLMLGYLLGALMTSITLGLVIVFSLEGSGAVRTTKDTLSPAATMTLGGIALAAAFVLGTGRHRPGFGRAGAGTHTRSANTSTCSSAHTPASVCATIPRSSGSPSPPSAHRPLHQALAHERLGQRRLGVRERLRVNRSAQIDAHGGRADPQSVRSGD